MNLLIVPTKKDKPSQALKSFTSEHFALTQKEDPASSEAPGSRACESAVLACPESYWRARSSSLVPSHTRFEDQIYCQRQNSYLENSLLDGVLGHQLVDKDRFLLPNAMYTFENLVLKVKSQSRRIVERDKKLTSTAGFHQGSKRIRLLQATRFKPGKV